MRPSVLCQCTRRVFAAAVVGMAGGCGTREKDKVRVLGKQTNARFGLTCEFIGQSVDAESRYSSVDLLRFRNDKTGDWQELVPSDPDTLRIPNSDFFPLWSPDEMLFVLPLGRLEGFRFVAADRLLQSLRDGQSTDLIRVQFSTGSRLFHEFVGWKGVNIFQFTAGRPGTTIPFDYDLRSGALSCPKSAFEADLRGFNAKGEIQPEITG